MARNSLRQTVLWCMPTVAVLLTFLWFRRKKSAIKSDPGGAPRNSDVKDVEDTFVKEKPILSNTSFDRKEPLEKTSVNGNCKVALLSEKTVIPNGVSSGLNILNCASESQSRLLKEDSQNSQVQKHVIPNNVANGFNILNCNSVSQSRLLEGDFESSQVENLGSVCRQEGECEDNSSTESSGIVMEESYSADSSKEMSGMHSDAEEELCKETLALDSPSEPLLLDKGQNESAKLEKKLNSEELTGMKAMDSITAEVNHLELSESNPSVSKKSLKTDQEFSNENKPSIIRHEGFSSTESNLDSSASEMSVKMEHGFSNENQAPAIPQEDISHGESNLDLNCESTSSSSVVAVNSVCEVAKENSAEKETLVKEAEVEEGACGGISSDAISVPVVERDSANHSPADVMLNSPSISHYSDNHSEGSSDSGKGCSYVATPPSRTPASCSSLSGDVPAHCVYEFVLPQQLIGRLIGRHGCFSHQIKAKTRANILVKRHPTSREIKICAVEGTQADIDAALRMIREKFPERRYPNVTLEQVSFLPPVPVVPIVPEYSQLQLVAGVNNDVIISTLVSPAHFFLQQPTHPTFPALNQLTGCMTMCYNESSAPALPAIETFTICAVPSNGAWYRAQIVAVHPDSDTCDVKFVDYGGFGEIQNTDLRQIRSDFMTLPFQASECYLAHVIPQEGACEWSDEATNYFEQLTRNQVMQAQVCGYAEDGIPVVYLFANCGGAQVVPIHQELVAQGLAEWWDPSES